MKKRKTRLNWVVCLIVFIGAVAISLAALWGWRYIHSDELWNIVNGECVPHAKVQENANASCVSVVLTPDEEHGYTVFKDRKGPLHFLLIPTVKIEGLESPVLQQPETTHYFLKAWQARGYLAQASDRPVARNMVSLTVNSAYARSQEQLHIHIACIRPEIKAQLDSQIERFSEQWMPVEYGLNGSHYLARTLTESQFQEMSPFRRMAKELPGAAEEMSKYGIALVAYSDLDNRPMYLLMVNRMDALSLNPGYTGDIQDYQCDLLKTTRVLG
ncbi:CDP-diacylglycerol pyrophosphatase [Leminorella richardii]|uniref:CDP-diacylglycerol pyrophosphatase n=1 Tax=Leminorella richardii TaxID=158841 RepID=A0A2X4U9T3_9GAMM|nr:CDP-diacylglycerol diphosphatase [Leminorella richardii]SQI35701.1 CDP-diacylglycerol pyrophosphatase [Leminorella richardii]